MDVEQSNNASPFNQKSIQKIHGAEFIVDIKYRIMQPIGKGSYGMVCSAINLETGQKVAIKKIENAFVNHKDTKRTLREIKLLRYFNHDNILKVIDVLVPVDRYTFDNVYIVTNLLETDLNKVINSDNQLSEDHVKYFFYQILRGVKHMHSANVLHRDLKPSNILVNGDCSLKICDFGMARIAAPRQVNIESGSEQLGQMTEYVATRWYRAPEVILSWKQYTKAIDIWSLGCILAELLGRKALFQGSDYMHQLVCIIEVIGSPSEEDLMSISNASARNYIKSIGYTPPANFQIMYPNASYPAIELLYKLLAFNPLKRIMVEEVLASPYLSHLHEPTQEPTAQPFHFDFEQHDLSKETYRELIYQEALLFHPELKNL